MVKFDVAVVGAGPAGLAAALSAKQNGEKLSPAVPKEDEPAIDNYIAEVEPGSTVTVCYAFSLNDKSDVTLEASEAFAFGGGNVTSQTIKLQ